MLNITNNILLLTKSIRIKFDMVARHINKQIEDKYGIEISDDRYDWKYYQNLCGVKHFTNTDVKVKILETNEEVSLTKEILDMHRYTKNELLKNEALYIELVDTYPADIDYIIGCLYPTTMDIILNSSNGSILTYNSTFIEDNENVISELETYIKNILARWHVDGYAIVEDLYPASILSVIYNNIPNKILNIRMNNIKTSRVHSFFLQEFFNSRLLLWNDVKYLNKPSIYWLYHNLDYLIKHVGKSESLYIIIEKIFEVNKVGIGTYQLHQTTPDIDTTKSVNELPYELNRSKIVTKALNNSYTSNKNEEMSIDEVTTLQLLETDPLKGLVDNQLEKTEYIVKNILDLLTNNDKGIENTKVLDIHTKDLFKINSDAMLDLVVNNLLHLVHKDKYYGLVDYSDPNTDNSSSKPKIGSIIEYTEPNNNQTYTLTPYSGILMLIALLLKLVGRDDEPLTYIKYYNVIDDELSIDEHLTHLFPDGYSEKILRFLHNLRPDNIDTIHTPYDMEDYINQIILFSKVSWVLDSNCENNIVSANIKHYLERITRNDKLVLSEEPKTIEDLLAEQGIDYSIKNSYDVVSSISKLLISFTNIEVDEYEELRLSMNAYKNIINKLTSYTTQVIDTVDNVNNRAMLYNNNPSAYYSKLGLLTVLDAYFQPLEDFIGTLNLELDDFRDETLHTFCNTNTSYAYLRKIEDLVGYVSIHNDKFARDDKPTNYIDLQTIPMFNILNEEFKDVFFKDVESFNYPLEDFVGESNVMLDDMRNNITSDFYANKEPSVYPNPNEIIKGKTIISTGNGIVYDNPTIEVDLVENPEYNIIADKYKDTFFKNVTMDNIGIEKLDGNVNTEISDIQNNLVGNFNLDVKEQINLKHINDINGVVKIFSGNTVITQPINNLEITPVPDYDILGEEYKDTFFKEVSSTLVPNVDIEIITSTGANDTSGEPIGDLDASNTPSSYLKAEEDVSGVAIINSTTGVIMDNPINKVDILDNPNYDISLEEYKDIFFKNIVSDSNGYSTDESPIDLTTGTIKITDGETVTSTAITSEQEITTDSTLTEITGAGQVYNSYSEEIKPSNTITIEEID